jgi:hypothetical protein
VTDEFVARVTESLRRNENVRSILLTGSRARGDAHPHSDLDLLVLVTSHAEPSFFSETVGGMLVEQHIRGTEEAKARLLERSLELYSYLDGCAVYDPDGLLAELTRVAKDRGLFEGDTAQRAKSMRELIDWLLEHDEGSDEVP